MDEYKTLAESIKNNTIFEGKVEITEKDDMFKPLIKALKKIELLNKNYKVNFIGLHNIIKIPFNQRSITIYTTIENVPLSCSEIYDKMIDVSKNKHDSAGLFLFIGGIILHWISKALDSQNGTIHGVLIIFMILIVISINSLKK